MDHQDIRTPEELKTYTGQFLERSAVLIATKPEAEREGLQREAVSLARAALLAIGDERSAELLSRPPETAIYSQKTEANAHTVSTAAQNGVLQGSENADLRGAVKAAALEAGIDSAKMASRLETGAANALQERDWVKSDIADVAAHHKLDMGHADERGKAAKLVDAFYEKAAAMITRDATLARAPEKELPATLQTMAAWRENQSDLRFENDGQAANFAADLKKQYGANIIKDLAEGRDEALANDFPDERKRLSVARAVMELARQHTTLELSEQEATAGRRLLIGKEHTMEQSRNHGTDHGLEL